MYSIIKNEATERYEWWNDDEFIAELDRQRAALESGEEKGIPWDEIKDHLLNRLNK